MVEKLPNPPYNEQKFQNPTHKEFANMDTEKPTKRALRRRVTPGRLMDAIKGTGGNRTYIAKRLQCTTSTVYRVLQDKEGPRWDDCRIALKMEEEGVGDLAEETVKDAMRQRLDMSVASTTARWHLDRKHADRGYGKKDQLTLEGGENPLHLRHQTLLPIDELDLPLRIKKLILTAMEKYEAKQLAEKS